jgi:signal transduction histidine kinase
MKRGTFPSLTLLWSGIAAFLLLLALLLAGLQYKQYNRTLEDTEDRLMTQARVINENLGANLTLINVLLTDIVRTLNGTPRFGVDQMNAYLRHEDDLIPGIRTIFVTNARGVIVFSSNAKILGFDGSSRDYFKTALNIPDPAGLVITPPFQTMLGTSVVTVTKAMKGTRGDFRGVVSATLDKDYFSALASSALYAPDNRITLVHSGGDVFISLPELQTDFTGKNLAHRGSLFERHVAGGQPVSMHRGLSLMLKEPRITVFMTCAPPDVRIVYPLVISVSRSMDAVLAPWRRDTAVLIALYLFLSGLTLAITVILIRYRREHKRAEEEHLKLRHLESLEILAAGMAHDFNNILTSVMGFVEIAKASSPPGDPVHDSMIVAMRNCLNAKELSRRLLTFATGGEHARVISPVNGLIEGSLEVLKETPIKVELALPDGLHPVPIDVLQMKQVFLNIVANAKDAMPEGGTLTILGENLRIHAGLNLPLLDGEYIKLTFRDSGVGIAPENLPRIFHPYFSTKEVYSQKGLGLGLAVCYSVIRRHNGLMTIDSELNIGTAIVIILPAFI